MGGGWGKKEGGIVSVQLVPESAVVFNLTPVAKPRMTQSDKWNPRPATAKYWGFKSQLCSLARRKGFELGESFRVTFYLPMPKSWSKAKRARMEGTKHNQKPDLSNCLKALEDSLLPDDDSGVWSVEMRKLWAIEGRIVIENVDVLVSELEKRGY